MLGKIHTVETAMLVGASIVLEQPLNPADEDLPITKEGEELLKRLFDGEADKSIISMKAYLEGE